MVAPTTSHSTKGQRPMNPNPPTEKSLKSALGRQPLVPRTSAPRTILPASQPGNTEERDEETSEEIAPIHCPEGVAGTDYSLRDAMGLGSSEKKLYYNSIWVSNPITIYRMCNMVLTDNISAQFVK